MINHRRLRSMPLVTFADFQSSRPRGVAVTLTEHIRKLHIYQLDFTVPVVGIRQKLVIEIQIFEFIVRLKPSTILSRKTRSCAGVFSAAVTCCDELGSRMEKIQTN